MNAPIYFEIAADIRLKNSPEFNRSARPVSELYESTLKLKVKGIRKLRIELSDIQEYIFNPPVKMFPLVLINKKFDFDSYWSATENERKLTILDTLQESVLDMCQKLELDKTPFEKTYKEVKSTLYVS